MLRSLAMGVVTHPIALYRQKHRLTLEELGQLIGVGAEAVHKWETGKTKPNWKNMAVIERVTNKEVQAAHFLPTEK